MFDFKKCTGTVFTFFTFTIFWFPSGSKQRKVETRIRRRIIIDADPKHCFKEDDRALPLWVLLLYDMKGLSSFNAELKHFAQVWLEHEPSGRGGLD